jgi:uncharacterized protein YggE
MQVSVYGRDTTYVTTETFTVRIRNFDLIGAVIDTALAAGAQTISNVNFERTETRGPYLDALDVATRQARENAEAMVRASGGQLGRLVELSTEGVEVSRFDPRDFGGVGIEAGISGLSEATTVVVPDVRISATVYARWQMIR